MLHIFDWLIFHYFSQLIFRLTPLTSAAKSNEKLVNQKSCHTVLILDVLYSIIIFYFSFRYYDYCLQKAELFMLDFCYFVNFSVVLQTAFFPDNLFWFKANYVLCMGPICIAIMVWKNSLVFHSLDKLTSFFLHAFPTMVSSILTKFTSYVFMPAKLCKACFHIQKAILL